MMKASRYNRLLPFDDGSLLAFNASSAALIRIRPEKRETFHRVLDRPEAAETEEERRFRDVLVDKRFLVEEGLDEVAQLAARNRRHRFGGSLFSLTLAPTLSCNLRCDYCYERPSPARMAEETESALLGFTDRRMPGAESVSVTWFGGEPTLCLDTIDRVQAGLGALAERHGAKLIPAGIVTNGWLLDRKTAERLAAAGVTTAQITLDGPREVHDRRRKLPDGRGTFDRILSNLDGAAGLLRCTVRVNLDDRNTASAADLVADLRRAGLLDRVSVSFAQVRPSDGACADVGDSCLSVEEFAGRLVALYGRLVEEGFESVDHPTVSPGGPCGADSDRAFVVAPDGTLFKCWEEIGAGDAASVGTIFSDAVTPAQRRNLDRYLGRQPLAGAECPECAVLPLCMGGCPLDAARAPGGADHACCTWKYNLDEMLKLRSVCGQRQAGRR
jgi:uncharacterized protein